MGKPGKSMRNLGVTWLIISVAVLLIAGAFCIAAYRASSRIKEIRWLAALPPADTLSTAGRPARYAGRLFGPDDRATPLGRRAAAYWWTVSSYDGDAGYDIKCVSRTRSRLRLAMPAGTMDIVWADADPDAVGLASDSDSGEYGRPFAIDIGNARVVTYDSVPRKICAYGERYSEAYLAQGTAVEVVGCVRGGAIDRCDCILGGVLSVPDITSDMRHRLRSAMHAFFFPMYFALALLLLATTALWRWTIYRTRNYPQAGNTEQGTDR